MSVWYLDTSAAMKLLVDEPESDALAATLDDVHPRLVACLLLETELRRAVARISPLTQSSVTTLLENVDLYDVPGATFREAGLLPGAHLRSLDAVHLASALRLDAERVATYDVRMSAAADELGLSVVAPGGEPRSP